MRTTHHQDCTQLGVGHGRLHWQGARGGGSVALVWGLGRIGGGLGVGGGGARGCLGGQGASACAKEVEEWET